MSSAAPIYPYAFEAEIEKFGVGKARKIWYNVLFLPADLRSQLPFESYPRLRVEGELADVPIANAFIPAGDGRNYVIVSPKVLQDAGVASGDWVEMRFRIADQDHVDVPDALSAALQAEPNLIAAWETLTPGKKRMVAQHVKSAKSAATLERRIREATDAVLHFKGDLNAQRRSS